MTEASTFTGPLLAVDKMILGASVSDPAGESLGTVEDLITDVADGRVIYVVISFGGLLGLGTQYYLVPWPLLTYDASSEGFTADLDKTRLENAPRYDIENEWTRRYASEVDSYYGITRPPL